MTPRETIKSDIEAKCRTGYSYWRIGLTHDVTESKKYWRDRNQGIGNWAAWTATSLFDARKLETHFVSQGMKCVTGGDLSQSKKTYVYVF